MILGVQSEILQQGFITYVASDLEWVMDRQNQRKKEMIVFNKFDKTLLEVMRLFSIRNVNYDWYIEISGN